MLTAILTDIHANREAFDAVMKAVAASGAARIVLLGDLVGYGPDPGYIVERAAELAARGALMIRGNHDDAALTGPAGMSELARKAILWTTRQLSAAQLEFLAGLPPSLDEGERFYVHDSADQPGRWHYVHDVEAASRCLAASTARTVFCGHTHVPLIFYALRGNTPVSYTHLTLPTN